MTEQTGRDYERLTGKLWCFVDDAPAFICNGPHREVETDVGTTLVKDTNPIQDSDHFNVVREVSMQGTSNRTTSDNLDWKNIAQDVTRAYDTVRDELALANERELSSLRSLETTLEKLNTTLDELDELKKRIKALINTATMPEYVVEALRVALEDCDD